MSPGNAPCRFRVRSPLSLTLATSRLPTSERTDGARRGGCRALRTVSGAGRLPGDGQDGTAAESGRRGCRLEAGGCPPTGRGSRQLFCSSSTAHASCTRLLHTLLPAATSPRAVTRAAPSSLLGPPHGAWSAGQRARRPRPHGLWPTEDTRPAPGRAPGWGAVTVRALWRLPSRCLHALSPSAAHGPPSTFPVPFCPHPFAWNRGESLGSLSLGEGTQGGCPRATLGRASGGQKHHVEVGAAVTCQTPSGPPLCHCTSAHAVTSLLLVGELLVRAVALRRRLDLLDR